MPTLRTAALPAAALAVLALSGCGPAASTMGAAAPASITSTPSDTSATPAMSPATPGGCPTSNTRSFAKTRFATDIGLTVGTFHRYIWKPYQAGTFKSGAHGRTLAIAKAVATAGLNIKLMDNAKKNVEANPILCNVLATPIGKAVDELGTLKGDLISGSASSVASVESTLTQLFSSANANGVGATETTNESLASQG